MGGASDSYCVYVICCWLICIAKTTTTTTAQQQQRPGRQSAPPSSQSVPYDASCHSYHYRHLHLIGATTISRLTTNTDNNNSRDRKHKGNQYIRLPSMRTGTYRSSLCSQPVSQSDAPQHISQPASHSPTEFSFLPSFLLHPLFFSFTSSTSKAHQ